MYHPYTHMEISRQRQADLVREASKRELVKLASEGGERTSLLGRLLAELRLHRGGAHVPSPNPAA